MQRLLNTFLFSILLTIVQAQSSKDFQPAIDAISPDAIKGAMTFLADDLLQGRQPGTDGFAIASKYVETQFMSFGLKPLGDNGGYIQKVPLAKGKIVSSQTHLKFYNKRFSQDWLYDSACLFTPNFKVAQSIVDAPLVFVGFGISAPELNYDDYKNIDVKDKIVVFIEQAPDIFGNNEKAYFTGNKVKYEEAEKHGAIGAIAIPLHGRYPWIAAVRRSATGLFKWVDKNGIAASSFPKLQAIASLNPDMATIFFQKQGVNLEKLYAQLLQGKPNSFALDFQARMEVTTDKKIIESNNIIGYISGSDSSLTKEYIDYTAHVDHFGIGVPVKGDSIYNGAHDDASGVAILLQVANAYTHLPERQKRPIIFSVVTGEESGLLGSDYFANNPTMNGKIIANLSLDMPFFFHTVKDIVPYGAQHSSLNKEVLKTADILGLKISPDPFPQQVIFIRSDHFSYIKKGIPSLFIKSGFMSDPSDTTNWSVKDVTWRTTTYHTPQDDMTQKFNFEGAATHAKLNFLIGYFVSQEPSVPTWNKGDFFGNKFGLK